MAACIRKPTVIALCALTLAACGDSGRPVRERSGDFSVTLDDYLIRPQQIRIPAAGRLTRLTVTVTNRGRLGHTFRIRGPNHNVLALTTIEPSETVSRSFRLGKGSYRMYCALANHEELGMYGSLVLR